MKCKWCKKHETIEKDRPCSRCAYDIEYEGREDKYLSL